MSRRILVVSIAGLTSADLTQTGGTGLGVLRTLAADGAVRPLAPVRPDTPAAWTAALVTGRTPASTGITADLGDPATTHDRPYPWAAADLPADTLFTAARAAGARTAVLGLPLTADPEQHLPIDWLCPDVTDVARWGTRSAMLEACSSPAVRDLLRPRRPALQRMSATSRDDLYTDLAVGILEQSAPDLTVVHLADLAAARREGGVAAAGAQAALEATDRSLGRLVAASRRAHAPEPPQVLLVSGGVRSDVRRQVHLNAVLRERGFLQASSAEHTDGWEALAMSCGASARIVLAHSIQPRRVLQLESVLAELAEQQGLGIAAVTRRADLAPSAHVDARTAYLVSGAPGTSFGDAWSKRAVVEVDDPYYDGPRAVAGAVAGGSGVLLAPGLELGDRPVSVLDLAPTLSALLGGRLPDAAGQVLLQRDGSDV